METQLNKSELADALASRLSVTKTAASEIVSAIFDAQTGLISSALLAGDEVSLHGFGTFRTVTRAARTAIKPGTTEKVAVPEKTVAKFKVGKNLSAAISGT